MTDGGRYRSGSPWWREFVTVEKVRKTGTPRLIHGFRVVFPLLLAMALPGVLFAAQADQSTPEPLRVSETVYLGAHPIDQDTPADGVDLIIDLRYPYEGVYAEMSMLSGQGIQLLNIPVSSSGPTLDNVKRLEDALNEAGERRILIHDSNGHRTAALWAAYRVWKGDPLESVVEALQPLYDAPDLPRMLERFRQETIVENGQ